MDQIEHLGDPRRDLVTRPFVRLQAIGDVFRDGHVRKQRVVLEHDADAAPARREMIDHVVVEKHPALGLPDEAGNDPQQGRLAAAGGSQQRHQFAAGDIEVDIADGDKIGEAVRDVLEPHAMRSGRRHLKVPSIAPC